MAALYTNENFPLPAALELRRLGHDVLTIQETGRADRAMPDDAVLEFAAEQQRVLITLNRRHFIRLHNAGQPHAGIVVCTFDPDFDALAQRVHETITAEPNLVGKLVRVNRP
jgi:hypothetical protein